MAIDVGAGAANYNSTFDIYDISVLDKTNPANADGTLDTFEVWLLTADAVGFKIGTFSGSGTSWSVRDFETIGAVTNGSKQTFTGKNCDVVTNDVLGCVDAGGFLSAIEFNTSAGSGVLYYGGDAFSGTKTFTSWDADGKVAMYATGTEPTTGLPIFMNYYQNIMR